MVAFSLVKALLLALTLNHVQAITIPAASIDSIVNREARANPIASSNINDRSVPLDQSLNPAEESKRSLQKRNNHCGNSSFINRTSGSAALVSDCIIIRDRQRATPRTYTIFARSGGTLASQGTCQFSISNNSAYDALVGNEDIADLITDSINRFQSGGRVGADGTMPCLATGAFTSVFVQWYLN